MILPDVNLLVYAYNSDSPNHDVARAWWEDLLNSAGYVAVPWAVACGFLRLITHPRVLVTPMPPELALDHLTSWFQLSNVIVVGPGPRHIELLRGLLQPLGVAANLTTDAHLAALAIEHQCELHSNDTDFHRFPGLRWRNPLVP